jgi:hypothetical protein
MTTVTKNAAVEGRFGFHPVDYATFRKLKDLHRWYWQTVYDVARWVRWDRKTVYQHGPEPKYCPTFVEEKGHWQTFTNKDGYQGMRYYPKTLNDHGIIEAYQSARMPKESPDDVEPLRISLAEIDRLHAEAKEYFGS